jgi:N utilization substance protein A
MANADQGMWDALRGLAASRGMSEEELQALLRESLRAGLVRMYGPTVEAEIDIDPASGRIQVVVLRTVVEEVQDPAREISLEEARWEDPEVQVGDVLEEVVGLDRFGRHAIAQARQRILQRVRELERDRIVRRFAGRIGDLLVGEVRSVEPGKIVVGVREAPEVEAIIPRRAQNPHERFRTGDPIVAALEEVDTSDARRGPKLILTRASPMFVEALFRREVPEIEQGVVRIERTVREVGVRTKIAVSSRDETIDPVGACVGVRGTRVRAVMQELGGERIDIVPWHPDPEVFAKWALAPAKVTKTIADEDRKTIVAVVSEDEYPAALGRSGQNVRLAAQLVGWEIEVVRARDWLERTAREVFPEEALAIPLDRLGLSAGTVAALRAAGYATFDDLLDLEEEDLQRVPGLGPREVEEILRVIERYTVVDEEEDEGFEEESEAFDEREPPASSRTEDGVDVGAAPPEGSAASS